MSDYSVSGLKSSFADVYDAGSTSMTNKIENTDFSNATDDELMSVCKDFESYFLEQVLKSMEKMAKIDPDDEDSNLFSSMVGTVGDTSDSSMKAMTSYFGDQMTTNMASIMTEANHGDGLGIAQKLYEQMKRNYGTTSIPNSSVNKTQE